jgi:hypothetical protein
MQQVEVEVVVIYHHAGIVVPPIEVKKATAMIIRLLL